MSQTTDIVATEVSSQESQINDNIGPKKRTFVKTELILLFCLLCIWALKSDMIIPDSAKAAILKQVVKISPNSASSHFFLGNVYHNLEEYEKAVGAYEAAIRIDPSDADFYRHLAGCYGSLGRYEEQIEAYRQVSRIDPDDAKAYSLLAGCYINAERYEDAAEAIKSLSTLDSHDAYRLFVILAFSCSRSGHYDRAIEACNRAIEVHPNMGTVHYLLAEVYLRKGDIDMALEEYGTLKTLNEKLANRLIDENSMLVAFYENEK